MERNKKKKKHFIFTNSIKIRFDKMAEKNESI